MTEPIAINEENFNLYFRDAAKNKKEEGDLTVSYRGPMELPDSELKRDLIRLLSEVSGGAKFAVEALMRYAAASKKEAIRVCGEISGDLLKGTNPDVVANRRQRYEIVLFFYVKPEHFPKQWLEEKNSPWAIVPEVKEDI